MFRWAGRIGSLATAALVLFFAIGEGLQLARVTVAEVMGLALVGLMLVGLLAAWRWEVAGATLAVVSLGGFAVLQLVQHRRLPGIWFFILFGIPAALYLVSFGLRCTGARRTFTG